MVAVVRGIGTAKRTFSALLTVHTHHPGSSPSRRAFLGCSHAARGRAARPSKALGGSGRARLHRDADQVPKAVGGSPHFSPAR